MAPFHENIRNLRTSRKLSLKELADIFSAKYGVKVGKSSISRWENGDSEPNISDANLYADYFGVSLDWLMDRDAENKTNTNTIETFAAHIDDDATEEEMEEIRKYFEYLKSRRK
ncbi:helix-turn-helix domain-containing protein [Domibacillus aminovorans]|uniref:HTH cro/C1-type domain-containing protein n=1 Tax=Domibacillus aminovorans TaxID=29332 RepID=A0A177L4L4_9BACI|nr:helix-turn-helix transcriptional regulator [Domibacillus aminovorans]OAH60374.1 hypothetical protein AWH49_16735 [Domibacillus aminovorans]